MIDCNSACEGLSKDNNKYDLLISQLLNEVKDLCKTSTAKFLFYDEKVAELCAYIKENLTNSIRCLINDMQLSGEIDKLITDAVLLAYKELEIDVHELKNKTVGIVTPQMFGACADGICDDTAAFKKAIETGKTIYIPLGKYLITDSLELTGAEHIIGCKDSIIIQETKTLFIINSYYNNSCVIDGLTVEVNKNTFIKSNRGGWGSSYIVKNIILKKCGGNTIINGESYNLTFDNCVFEGDFTATGTMIKLCEDNVNSFSNVITFNSCVISGNKNMDLVDCSKAYRVNAYNTTFTNCNVAIKGVMGCFGCWFEAVELCSSGKNAYFECHFADVTRINPKTKDEDDNYIIPSLVANPTFNASNTTLLEEVFKRQPVQLFYPKVAGNINGIYNEFLPFDLQSNKIIANVPLNTVYKEGTGQTVYLPVGDLKFITKGTLFVEIECYRVLDGEVKQNSKSRGILKNNIYTELEKTDTDTTYKSRFGWDAGNLMFSVTDWHEGQLIARCHIERVSA